VLLPRPRRRPTRTFAACLVALGCDPAAPAAEESAAPAASDVAVAEVPPDEGDETLQEIPPDLGDAAEPAPPPPARRAPPAQAPIETRQTERAMMIYPAAAYGPDFRGKLQRRENFFVYEHVAGDPECEGDGWGRVGVAAYACLEHTAVVRKAPRALPRRASGQLTPYYYARRPKTPSDPLGPARWASRAALRDGAQPVDRLQPDHDYAFVRRRHLSGHGAVLTDGSFRAVRERDVRVMSASDFHGRDVLAEPLREDATAAWSVVWRYAAIRSHPREDAEETGRVLHHEMFYIDDAPEGSGRYPWYPVADGSGWVWGKEMRKLTTMSPPAEVSEDELWLDVDLQQQTLSVLRGPTLQYVTLVASGNYEHPTPAGLYRVSSKMGYSDMRSRAGDDEAYYVEGVPWVMYFDGRYALHGTFWHNRFGHRTSHGCVNLSATDAKYVFDLVDPELPDGWLTVYEHAEAPGTLVRIRNGTNPVEDRRTTP
jgi:hypothetical protein